MLFYERINDAESPSPVEEDVFEPAGVPLPPDEANEWDVVSDEPCSEATPSLVTSSAHSVVSESDIDTEMEDDETAVPSAGKLPLHAPILKTASPAGMHHGHGHRNEMNLNQSLMSV